MTATDGTTAPLGAILEDAETDQKTARALNVTDEASVRPVADYLSKHGVDLHVERTESRQPTDALLLESDGRFLAASPLARVARFADARATDRELDGRTPAVVAQLDDTRFDSYDKQRMVLASRIVEFRAWNHRDGELHAGFQQLSKVDLQRNVYRNLSTVPLDVHVYGAADWDRPDDLDVHVHADDGDEVARHWWVVYDGNGRDEDKATLLAREVGDGEFFGFWTYDPVVADRVLDRLEAIR